jgi:N-acetylmuramoyl-L-alanine amidase
MNMRVMYGRRQVIRFLSGGTLGLVLSASSSQLWARTMRRSGRERVVMIDPGHGGIDPGCIGIHGTREKLVALATATAVARHLERTGQYRVMMTRRDDEYIPLMERVAMAQQVGADLFMSVHADANPNHSIHGASVYTLSEKASDAEAAALADRENHADDHVVGLHLANHEPLVNEVLYDLSRRQTNNQSQCFAQAVVSELGRHVELLDNTHRSAGFVVLKAPDIPSALVELGCLSNASEERELRQSRYQQKLAASLARSITDYFERV